MDDTTEINVRGCGGERKIAVPVIYRRGAIVVHETFMGQDFTVSNEACGFAYKTDFTRFQAQAFADYVAAVPELANIKAPEDTLRLKKENPKVVHAMKDQYTEITGRDW